MNNVLDMLWFFLNPLNVLSKGWLAILDVFTFFIIPYILLKAVYHTVWWRATLFYMGFVLTQINVSSDPILEYFLELTGILLMLCGCIIGLKKTSNKHVIINKNGG